MIYPKKKQNEDFDLIFCIQSQKRLLEKSEHRQTNKESIAII